MTIAWQPLAILLLACSAASAGTARADTLAQQQQQQQKIWRCGNNNYTDQPCAAGRKIDVDDPRSAADQRAADAATRSNREAADALAQERRRLEAGQAQQRPIVIGERREQPPTTASTQRTERIQAQKKRRSALEAAYFTASGPGSASGTKKKQAAPAAAP